ncbi:hypothetical protein [Thiosocius teredinicola]|uniref:hypothetical protein n=1 Tax=Thiosocius teredinicola TaxID=1973002 RepID=UPI000990EF20
MATFAVLSDRVQRLDQLPPDAIEERLAHLIRHYLQTRSPAIAGSVVRHIETLCAHPAFEGGATELCSYLRLKTHWRWLARQANGTLEA